jgi:ABC-type bacteriocin/lantibiotic exporter with double-glycine peptidase domain
LQLRWRYAQYQEAVPVPSIINWKLNHYAAIVEERQGRYRIQDPTFGSGDMWVTQAAIDAESSGYFLVPNQVKTPSATAAWRDATEQEASSIYGMGNTTNNEPSSMPSALPSASTSMTTPWVTPRL